MRELRQWGVGVLGGCEALVHFRNLVEYAAVNGHIDPLVVTDTDLENCFCTLEWDKMREDLQLQLPNALPWVSWQQAEPVAVVLPCGEDTVADRGAEQGEPFGSIETAVMVGSASQEAHQDLERQAPPQVGTSTPSGFVDHWYVDDGQFFTKPSLADAALRHMDMSLGERWGQPRTM
jgi:hypothetical protein